MDSLGDGRFVRCRAELGVSSFGFQLLNLPANDENYPEHAHANMPPPMELANDGAGGGLRSDQRRRDPDRRGRRVPARAGDDGARRAGADAEARDPRRAGAGARARRHAGTAVRGAGVHGDRSVPPPFALGGLGGPAAQPLLRQALLGRGGEGVAQLVRRELAAPELRGRRDEVARGAEHCVRCVGERAQDLVALQERLPGQRRVVGGELRVRVALLAEGGVRLLDRAHGFSFSLRSALTTFAFALPFVSRITWPTKKPSRPCFPARYAPTWSGFSASTRSTMGSSSDSSLIDASAR